MKQILSNLKHRHCSFSSHTGNSQQKTRLSASSLTGYGTDVSTKYNRIRVQALYHKSSINQIARVLKKIATPFGLTMTTALFIILYSLFMVFPSPAHAANSGIFTVELWAKPTSTVASQALVGKAEELRVFTDASGNAGCQIKSTTWQTAATGTTAVTLNSWNHIACAYDKSTLKIYVNGVQAASTSLTATIDDTSNALLLGQDSSASTPYSNLTGQTDDFKFYNYARTQQQIIEDMTNGSDVGGSGYTSANSSTGGSIAKPVGYWKFDEGYGTTANNVGSGGSTLNGTLTNMSSPATSTSGWTQSGKVGKALVFDGTNDQVSTNLTLNNNSPMTYSTWFKTTTVASTQRIISQTTGTAGDNFIRVNSNATLSMRFGNATVGTTSTTVLANTWYHLVATWDGSSTAILYLNGQPVLTGAYGNTVYSSGEKAVISGYNAAGTTTEPFNGSIDEVKIYNYALTADQVKMDMNQGAAQVVGAISDNSSYQKQAANQEYCIPGDSTSCAAPVGRWDFDEGTGSSVNDSSGNANTGTWNGTGNHWKVGKMNKSGNFNGTDDYVRITDNDTLDFPNNNNFTINAWIYLSNYPGGGSWRGIVDKEGSDGNGRQGYTTWVNGSSSGSFQIGIERFKNNTPDVLTISPGSAFILNTWNFVSFIYDGSSLKTYLNGQLQGSTSSSLLLNNTTWNVTIGARQNGGSSPYSGKIDQVRIFNYARTAAQVAWDYNKGAPVGWWKMDECQGTVANDSSGNGNTGTITIGASGTQTTAGTCTDGSSASAWNNGKTGKKNYSLNFDGTDDRISVTSSTGIPIGNTPYTISAWIKPTSYGTYGIVGWGTWGSGNAVNAFRLTSSGLVNYWWGNDLTLTVPNLTNGSWHHVTALFDGTTRAIYVDGVKIGSDTPTGHNATFSDFNIGRTNTTEYFPGQIDDTRVYNYALTPTQIKTLFNEGAYRVGPTTGAP